MIILNIFPFKLNSITATGGLINWKRLYRDSSIKCASLFKQYTITQNIKLKTVYEFNFPSCLAKHSSCCGDIWDMHRHAGQYTQCLTLRSAPAACRDTWSESGERWFQRDSRWAPGHGRSYTRRLYTWFPWRHRWPERPWHRCLS